MVLPAETSEEDAQRLVAEALAPTNRRTAPELLAKA
jgi:hypothetical protein